jgi:hypothetical protein
MSRSLQLYLKARRRYSLAADLGELRDVCWTSSIQLEMFVIIVDCQRSRNHTIRGDEQCFVSANE